MELAAIASAAVPGLTPTGVAGVPDDAADFESALLVDDSGKQWRVRSPKHPDASMRLETELQALKAFTPAMRAELPFQVPHIAGTLRHGELCTFVYAHLEGSPRELDGLAAGGPEMVRELGRTLAAIHDLPPLLVHNADLPSYEANEFRQRKLNELDQAAITGRIPAHLLRRWEHALEDVTLWRFHPTVVHGDLHEDNLVISAGRVSAVTGWTDLRVGDPADDFAWLLAATNPRFAVEVHDAYLSARADAADPHLMRRAALAAEFALAQWLVRGVAMDNAEMIAEAEDMMATLDRDLQAEEASAAAYLAAQEAHLAEQGPAGGTDDGYDSYDGHPNDSDGFDDSDSIDDSDRFNDSAGFDDSASFDDGDLHNDADASDDGVEGRDPRDGELSDEDHLAGTTPEELVAEVTSGQDLREEEPADEDPAATKTGGAVSVSRVPTEDTETTALPIIKSS
ncbi:phosphotransferase [Arthrobacter sp. 260]|nr:macrolide 2'-phosphotransferase [Arthrobacter sp. 260]NOJ58502.1 phosphotransferase [Arthrobacter sp. 260]